MISNTKEEKIHIIMSVESIADSYNQHVGVTLTSIISNSSLPIAAYILYCNLVDESSYEYQQNYTRYFEIKKKTGSEINLIHVPLDINTSLKEYFLTHPKVKILSPAAALRCFAPEVLPDVDWAIYLDTDIIVRLDLAELWIDKTSNSDAAIIGCLDEGWDFWPESFHNIHAQYGLRKETYVNSGMLIMNLRKIREEYDLNTAILPLFNAKPKLPFYDQDVINIIFKDDIQYLPSEKYNTMIHLHPERIDNNCIMHHAAKKPWKTFDYNIHKYYWHYLLSSPWGDVNTIYPLVDTLINTSSLDSRILTGSISNWKMFLANLSKKLCREAHSILKNK